MTEKYVSLLLQLLYVLITICLIDKLSLVFASRFVTMSNNEGYEPSGISKHLYAFKI